MVKYKMTKCGTRYYKIIDDASYVCLTVNGPETFGITVHTNVNVVDTLDKLQDVDKAVWDALYELLIDKIVRS